jgi:hypothetical protein
MVWPATLLLRALLILSIVYLMFQAKIQASWPMFGLFFLVFLIGQDVFVLTHILAGTFPDLRTLYSMAFRVPRSSQREVFQQGYQVIQLAPPDKWPLRGVVHRIKADAERQHKALEIQNPECSYEVVSVFIAYQRH